MPKPSSVVSELKSRGLVSNITNEAKLCEALDSGMGVYIGFDPTARSLHLGNYQQINVLLLFARCGVPIVPVLGGATGMIGDPSGKSAERTLQNEKNLSANSKSIGEQLRRLTDAEVVNNKDFYRGMGVLDFLRDIGKSFSVNYMLEKEQVATRLSSGISYTEFSYMILQSYDFYRLYAARNVGVQGGGSDQWGNITAGVDYLRKRIGEKSLAAGITFNLLTKADGQKFGKSEKGAVFLDESLTSAYEMYQFLLNQADEDMDRLLKALTMLDLKTIEAAVLQQKRAPADRPGQKLLAETIVAQIHGPKRLQEVQNVSALLFKGGDLYSVGAHDLLGVARSLDPFMADRQEYDVTDLLIKVGACASKREARELLEGRAVLINGKPAVLGQTHGSADGLEGGFSLIKKGKRSYFAVFWPADPKGGVGNV